MNALEELNNYQKDGILVIQPADKNGGICILDRQDYVEEANRQLDDVLTNEHGEESRYYQKSSEKAVNQQFKVIQETIEEGVELGYFSKEFGKQLLPEKPKPSKLMNMGRNQDTIKNPVKKLSTNNLKLFKKQLRKEWS